MKLLAEITEKEVAAGDCESFLLGSEYRLRKSARAILLNDKGEMATQYVSKYGYHKFPGGGVEVGESLEDALARELIEEVGCKCEIERLIGVTIEYRNKYKLLHISYCFVAKVVGDLSAPQLELKEIEEGQETHWLPPVEILKQMEKDDTDGYKGRFILAREMTFLKEFLDQCILK